MKMRIHRLSFRFWIMPNPNFGGGHNDRHQIFKNPHWTEMTSEDLSKRHYVVLISPIQRKRNY